MKKLEKFKDLWFNYEVKVLRGEKREECVFTFADLPFMNPLDWINCWKLSSEVRDESMRLDVLVVRDHMISMTRNYINLLATVDHEIATTLGVVPTARKLKSTKKTDVSEGQIVDEPFGIITLTEKKPHILPIEGIYFMKNQVFHSVLTKVILNSKNFDNPSRHEITARFRWWNEVRKILVEIAKFFKDN